jgi:hypothetical protein
LSVVLTGGNVNDCTQFTTYLRRHRIPATIPERRDQRANRLRRGRAGGRPSTFDRAAYRRRNIVER